MQMKALWSFKMSKKRLANKMEPHTWRHGSLQCHCETDHTMHMFVYCRQQIQWMSQQLSSEAVKCRQLEQKNLAMQHHLEDLLGHNYVLVEKQTMDAIQQSFSDFEKFIQKLRNLGYYLYLSWCCSCSPSLLLSHFVLCIKCLKKGTVLCQLAGLLSGHVTYVIEKICF